MFSPLADLGGEHLVLLRRNVDDYVDRFEQAAAVVASACGSDAAQELSRLRQIRQRLQATAPQAGPAQFVAAVGLGRALPLVVELVLTYRDGVPRGFGYLTEGSPAASLPLALGGLLEASLELFLRGSAARQEAALLADLFHLAFPDLAALADFSPSAQGMLMGFVPAGSGLHLKAYFNTRLAAAAGHRQTVLTMLEHIGVARNAPVASLYDALYRAGATFSGVGADIAGDGNRRAKIYVRVAAEEAAERLQQLARELGIDIGPLRWPPIAAPELFTADVELAIALRPDAAPRLKSTLFVRSQADAGRVRSAVSELLRSAGCDVALFERAYASLRVPDDRGAVCNTPLHGVGFEYPAATPPKLNVYLQPVL